jgi:ubiquinone/menaquinone biosynthesis C-methylase UbiE
MPHWDMGYFNVSPQRKKIAPRKLKNRLLAWELGQEYYDGSRENGYGGYSYQESRWLQIADNIFSRYSLNSQSKILDIGTKKGFFIQAIKHNYPNTHCIGIENHDYPIENSDQSIKNCIERKEYHDLQCYKDNSFDFVFAFSSLYMQNLGDIIKSLKHIQRLSNGKSYITLGAFNTEKERLIFNDWTLIGTTVLSCNEWLEVMKFSGYTGDYFFTTPKVLGLVD